MRTILWLVLREMRQKKRHTVLLCAVIALAEASLFSVLALGGGYWRCFLEQAALAGKEPLALARDGVADVIGMLLALVFQFWYGNTGDVKTRAWDILSGEAALKNLPAFILLTSLVSLIAVTCAVDLLLSVHRNQRRHFLNSLLVGGADLKFVRRYAVMQALCVWIAATPAVVFFDTAELLTLRVCASVYFDRFIGASPPVDIRGSLPFAAGTALLILGLTICGFRKNAGGLSVKTAAQLSRQRVGAQLGISTFTGEPVYYRVLGLPHYVALRNIEDRIGRYLKIIFMITLNLSTLGCMLLLLTFIRNYAAQASGLSPSVNLVLRANEFLFCASAAVTLLIAAVGTVGGVISHIVSNTPEYAQLRAAGASLRVIRRCARREGALCVAISLAVSVFWMVLFVMLFVNVYDPLLSGKGLDFSGVLKPLAVLCSFSLFYSTAVLSSAGIAARKLDRIDLLKELKELAYS